MIRPGQLPASEVERNALLAMGLSPSPTLLAVFRAGYQSGVNAQKPQREPARVKSEAELGIERLWRDARGEAGHPIRGPRLPMPGTRQVLVVLRRQGSAIGTEVARRAGLSQSNVTALYLPRLRLYGFVSCQDRPDLGSPYGGIMAQEWALTAAGADLAELCEQLDEQPTEQLEDTG